jgi:NADPH2:quinone reductase
VGVAAVELARNAGATVIAAASTDDKRSFAIKHGAHTAVPNDTLRDAVMAATGNAGVDLVYDPVGGSLFDAALRTVKPFGRIVTLGFASGTVPHIPANLLLVKNISVIGHNMGLYYGWSPRDERVQHEPKMRAMMNELFALTVAGKLHPHVSHRFTLDQFRDAMQAIKSRAAQGKVIIRLKDSA